MKRKLIYILTFILLVFVYSCVKNSSAPVPPVIPSGTFNGQFLLLKLQKNNSVDTTKASLQLQLAGANGYTVTGDTSTLHAGSYGTYTISITNVQFIDKTYSAKSTSAKIHLNGVYQYSYDGLNLQIVLPGDSVGMVYNLKKTGS